MPSAEPSTEPSTTDTAPLPTRLAEAAATSSLASRLVEPLQRLADLVPRGGTLDSVLRGKPLGHPLHPALSDVPIGLWTSAVVLDLSGRRYERAARRLVGLGLLAVAPTALAGLADWRTTEPPARGAGAAHAALNSAGAALLAGSWVARRRGHRARGVLLALAGTGAAGAGAYLGGHLVFVEDVPDRG
ncbi:hypothetical protein GCM10023221_33380 [Luteimicrobium xylanilyticum]|uniref:DUF2231 domain-containing protein n=1 Tax=Luteimicrobium xylanilyticum TaxID=1133546 RepID=A0A5P9Q9L1_9MICO|nr:DUF2231 domain-containing protein [Luteimicrobium xylanilyticum]QFU98138.1 hypothetical protein KDY119_01647 [Luteimicrobium xylanilyticum]